MLDDQERYIHQLCADTGCCEEDLQKEMDDRDRWGEKERENQENPCY